MQLKKWIFLFLVVMITMGALSQAAIFGNDLAEFTPPELYKWKEWVLYDNGEALCPTRYNDGDAYICTWPTTLELDVEKRGGNFTQQWVIFSETMVPLPGDSGAWPVNVTVDGEPAPVVSRDALPAVLLPAGTHTVAGEFAWTDAPRMINVPPAVGLVSLTLFGQEVQSHRMEASGLLWLREDETERAKEDRYEMAVFRLITDTIPMQLTTRLQLKISGAVREIPLPGLLISGMVPTEVASELPVRVGEAGEVVIQARPGTWDVRITSRSTGPVSELVLENPLVETEVWSFEARNQLRMVEIEGAPAVDASRTEMPDEWTRYPAYLLGRGEVLTFEELRRGDPAPSPDRLTLYRTLWLDFGGGGFTVRDLVSGTLSRSWSLALNPPAQLGRVSVDGQDMLITRQGEEGRSGVQLRKGSLDLEADLRLEDASGPISAAIWDQDFQQVSGTLNLPPGWRLFSAAGIDAMPGTWLQEWTLMDIFMVLIISVALFKLRGWRWGLAALVTLSLVYNEAGAPRTVWLFIIAAMALTRAVPEGRFRRLVNFGGIAAAVVLLVIAVPFMVQQLQYGFFPQLEPVGYAHYAMEERAVMNAAPMESVSLESRSLKSTSAGAAKEDTLYFLLGADEATRATDVTDPDALVQTGPGVPDWTWRAYPFSWNGPVTKDQEIRFRLISPAGNLGLSILRVLMLALMIFCVVNTRTLWRFAGSKKLVGTLTASVLLGLLVAPAMSKAAGGSAFPSRELLQEFEERLLERHVCYPNCADIPTLEIEAREDSLRLLLEVDAAVDTAVPLPVTAASWQPESILLDGRPIEGLSREGDGALWALVPEGIHRLLLSGSTRSLDEIQLPFSLKPHFVSCESSGWEAVGIGAGGGVGESVRLTRLDGGGSGDAADHFETGTLPAFIQVERTFHLGITWTVTTEFSYRVDSQVPVTISYPLLDTEAVTTAGVEVKKGRAVITMAPGRSATMASTLEISPEIRLTAPENVSWTETWILDASPIWSCGLSGISPVHHQDDAGQWRPTWRPWPGEVVQIAVTRPEAVEGQSVTIDTAALSYALGRRYHQADLKMSIRTSRGGRHQMELPEGAELQQLAVDGRSLPVEQEGRQISFPLEPGNNAVFIQWQQAAASGILTRSPEVTIGARAVNADVTFSMPENRWILLAGGPRFGPAVLFWSYLMVVVLAAFCLKYVTVTPLKFRHWLLLGVGLTQVPAVMAIVVVAWFVAMGFRKNHYVKERWFSFDMIQVGLFFLTLLALGCLYRAVQQGLLGTPDMQIAGNGSTGDLLRWTQDRIDALMPGTWVVAVPMWMYHLLMLLWSLWLAFSLVTWLRWGWECYGKGGLWRKRKKKVTETAAVEGGRD